MTANHTPGPWRWEMNPKAKRLQLCGGAVRYDETVMDFVRWGMDSAAPRFRVERPSGSVLEHCSVMGVVVPGREHHSNWFQAIRHPDADLIATAPDLLKLLARWRAEAHTADNELCELTDAAIAKATGSNK